MDIYETRRQRLRQLIDERFDGVVKRCAEALEMKPPQLHRWLSTTSKDQRRMEYDSARNIEDRLGVRPLWLDNADLRDGYVIIKPGVEEPAAPPPIPAARFEWPFRRINRERFFALTADEREAIEDRLEEWIRAYEMRVRVGRSRKQQPKGLS